MAGFRGVVALHASCLLACSSSDHTAVDAALPDGPPTVLSISSPRYDLGAALVGVPGAPAAVTVTNAGSTKTGALTTSITAPFSASGTCDGAALDPGASCTVDLTFTPLAVGEIEAPLAVSASNGAHVDATILGEGLDGGTLQASHDQVDFGAIAIDVEGAVRELLISNPGATVLSGGIAVRVTGQDADTFAIIRNECDAYSLADVGVCGLVVGATAHRAVPARAILAITSPMGGATLVPLTTTGFVAESLSITGTTSVTFPATAIGSMSAAQTVTVLNTGSTNTGPIIAQWSVGEFLVTGNGCANGLEPRMSCTLEIVGAPTSAGTHASTLRIQGEASGGVMMTGSVTALAPGLLDVERASVTLPLSPTGPTAPAANAVLRIFNRGETPLAPTAAVTGTEFTINFTACTVIPARAFCTAQLRFKPVITGVRTATLTVTNGAQIRTVDLSGVGDAGSVLHVSSAAQFPLLDIGTAQTIALTLTNTEAATVTIGTPTVAAPFALVATTCGATLAIGASCSFTIRFNPTDPGSFVGTLLVPTNAGIVVGPLSGTARAQFTIPTAGTFRIFPPPDVGADTCVNSCTRTSRFATWQGTYVPEPATRPAQSWGMLASTELLCNGVGRSSCTTTWPHTSLTALHQ